MISYRQFSLLLIARPVVPVRQVVYFRQQTVTISRANAVTARVMAKYHQQSTVL
jgi:hypothetical protein